MKTQQVQQSASEISAISVQWSQTRCPEGFVIGSGNGAVIQAWLAAQNIPITLDNISLALQKVGGNLEWQPGYSPDAVKPAKKLSPAQEQANREQALMSVGVLPQRVLDHANRTESQSDLEFNQAKIQMRAATERMAKEATGKAASATATATAAKQIPLNATPDELKKFNATEIRAWMGRRRRAGLAV